MKSNKLIIQILIFTFVIQHCLAQKEICEVQLPVNSNDSIVYCVNFDAICVVYLRIAKDQTQTVLINNRANRVYKQRYNFFKKEYIKKERNDNYSEFIEIVNGVDNKDVILKIENLLGVETEATCCLESEGTIKIKRWVGAGHKKIDVKNNNTRDDKKCRCILDICKNLNKMYGIENKYFKFLKKLPKGYYQAFGYKQYIVDGYNYNYRFF